MSEIDLDAILAQRAEATGGSPDEITFTFAGQRWTVPHPMLADDDWKDGLADLDGSDVDMARYYLGDEQYARFREAGGRAGYVLLLIRQVAEDMRAEMPGSDGQPRPTRRATSSAPRRKPSKRT